MSSHGLHPATHFPGFRIHRPVYSMKGDDRASSTRGLFLANLRRAGHSCLAATAAHRVSFITFISQRQEQTQMLYNHGVLDENPCWSDPMSALSMRDVALLNINSGPPLQAPSCCACRVTCQAPHITLFHPYNDQ